MSTIGIGRHARRFANLDCKMPISVVLQMLVAILGLASVFQPLVGVAVFAVTTVAIFVGQREVRHQEARVRAEIKAEAAKARAFTLFMS